LVSSGIENSKEVGKMGIESMVKNCQEAKGKMPLIETV
jgi:hypothetical protein